MSIVGPVLIGLHQKSRIHVHVLPPQLVLAGTNPALALLHGQVMARFQKASRDVMFRRSKSGETVVYVATAPGLHRYARQRFEAFVYMCM